MHFKWYIGRGKKGFMPDVAIVTKMAAKFGEFNCDSCCYYNFDDEQLYYRDNRTGNMSYSTMALQCFYVQY